MTRTCGLAGVVVLLATLPAWTADGKYAVKTMASPAPKEVKEPLAKLLSDQGVQFSNAKGETIAEVWFRKEVPAKATAAQIKNGLTYREVDETTFLGAVRFDQQVTDYRGQKIKPGAYTMRLGYILMDGDHMGVSPYGEFVLLTPAERDESPDPLKDIKALVQMSKRSTGTSHPGVFMLFPNPKPEDAPKAQDKGTGHWVLFAKGQAAVDGQKAPLGLGLVLIGRAAE